MITSNENWIEKYRSKTLDDMALPQNLRKLLDRISQNRAGQNLLLTGSYGVGKTTIAKILCATQCQLINNTDWEEQYYMRRMSNLIEAAEFRKLVGTIQSPDLFNDKRFWLIDEFDKATKTQQESLFGALEEGTSRNSFTLTANVMSDVHPGIQDRCEIIKLDFSHEEPEYMTQQFFIVAKSVLENENVSFDPKTLSTFCRDKWQKPRQLLSSLQTHCLTGELRYRPATNTGT